MINVHFGQFWEPKIAWNPNFAPSNLAIIKICEISPCWNLSNLYFCTIQFCQNWHFSHFWTDFFIFKLEQLYLQMCIFQVLYQYSRKLFLFLPRRIYRGWSYVYRYWWMRKSCIGLQMRWKRRMLQFTRPLCLQVPWRLWGRWWSGMSR